MAHGKLTQREEAQVKTGLLKKFVWLGSEYTFDPKTKMVGGFMEYHIAHAEPAMQAYVASLFPVAI